jgi:hypothetical protein
MGESHREKSRVFIRASVPQRLRRFKAEEVAHHGAGAT